MAPNTDPADTGIGDEMTTKDKRTGWLRDLKAGDLVLVVDPWWDARCEFGQNANIKPPPVQRITPSGLLHVDGMVFGPNGRQRGEARRRYLRAVSAAQLLRDKREELLNRIRAWACPPSPQMHGAPLELLEQVAALIARYQPTREKEN